MTFGVPGRPLRGSVPVPGDKSLSHRAVLFAAMAQGTSHVTCVLDSADVRSTIECVSLLGARVDLGPSEDGVRAGSITGWGAGGPTAPESPLDCGNSGTTSRLLLGVLAGWPIEAQLTGDESLSKRPMLRVTEPLARMGARFETATGGTLPVRVHGSGELLPLDYRSPVASAQVKTAILLAGLRASGETRVTEPSLSRDHTERLLPAFGVSVRMAAGNSASVIGPTVPVAADIAVPRDPSSAAFLVVAAQLVDGSVVELPGVSVNPTRIGFFRVLERMGADVIVTAEDSAGAEPVGRITSRYSRPLRSTVITAEEVPSLVDEVPVLALLASQAEGVTRFEGVHELRVKESDRLQAIAEGLSLLGVTVRYGDDWLEVDGPAQLRGARLDSLGDHRLAMVWALAGLIASEKVTVTRFEAVEVSYPGFASELARLGA